MHILAHTICERKEKTRVTETELMILWCMLQSKPCNLAQHLREQISKQVNSDYNPIVIGGLISPLLECAGVNFGNVAPIPGDILIDMRRFVGMHWIRTRWQSFWWRMHGLKLIPLPNNALIYTVDANCRDNLLISMSAHHMAIQEVKRVHGAQLREGNDGDGDKDIQGNPRGDQGNQQELPSQPMPQPMHQGDSSAQACRRSRVSVEERVDELLDHFSTWDASLQEIRTSHVNLVTRFGVF